MEHDMLRLLSMRKRENTSLGFTIVELLIVIVVIAILAAISIVAYNGIQTRAALTKEQNDLNILVKAINLYVANGGSMRDGVAGAAGGLWYGGADGKSPSGSYAAQSMREALQSAGYLPASFTRNFMLALCDGASTATDRRAVMILANPAPATLPADQTAPIVCSNANFTVYTDPAQQYKMNLVKVVF